MSRRARFPHARRRDAPATIPDDSIWDAERECWYPPGEPSTYDAAAELLKTREVIRQARLERADGPGLVSAEELLGAEGLRERQEGRARRKSLRSRPAERTQLDLFSDLADDEDTAREE